MLNVLTKDLRNNLEKDYKRRKFLLWLVISIFILFYITIILTPSFVFVVSEKKSLDITSESVKKSQNSKDDVLTKKIFDDTNNYLVYINSTKSPVYVQDLLNKIVSFKNTGIRLTDVLYQSQTSSTSILTLRGVASNREALISFSKNISSDPLFKNVNIPVSNFAKDKNISFSFDINVLYDQK
jgi:hypothetical protein